MDETIWAAKCEHDFIQQLFGGKRERISKKLNSNI